MTDDIPEELVERVAYVLAPHLLVTVGCNPDCDDQTRHFDNAVMVARAAITAAALHARAQEQSHD